MVINVWMAQANRHLDKLLLCRKGYIQKLGQIQSLILEATMREWQLAKNVVRSQGHPLLSISSLWKMLRDAHGSDSHRHVWARILGSESHQNIANKSTFVQAPRRPSNSCNSWPSIYELWHVCLFCIRCVELMAWIKAKKKSWTFLQESNPFKYGRNFACSTNLLHLNVYLYCKRNLVFSCKR